MKRMAAMKQRQENINESPAKRQKIRVMNSPSSKIKDETNTPMDSDLPDTEKVDTRNQGEESDEEQENVVRVKDVFDGMLSDSAVCVCNCFIFLVDTPEF